jgi:glycosyltransferase involved in cell wall biosynthesis
LNLALDATYSLGRDLSGVGVYSAELLAGLTAAHPEARFTFCYRSQRFLRSFQQRVPDNAGRFLLTETRVPRSADLFHGLNQRLPAARPRRAVTTFHDLFVLTGDYSTPDFRRRFAEQARQAAERSDRIIAVSQFTANQVVALLGVEPSRVDVVHHGVRAAPPNTGLREKVILHVGAIQRRKNVARLVEAFEKVDSDWQLVLAGSAGYGAEQILARIEASPCRDRIQVLGYVPAVELDAWYRHAAIFAFPSLDEGFGLPVLEAMAAGTPVLASNRSALPEVAGDAAWLIDPENTGELENALLELARDENRRADLAGKGTARAAQFTWERAVDQTWQLYQDLLAKPG